MATYGDMELGTKRGHDDTIFSVRSVDPRIHLLQARIAPITAIMQNLAVSQGNDPAMEIEWIERETMPNTYTATGAENNTDLVGLTFDESLVQIGDYVRNHTTSEVLGPVTVRGSGVIDVGERGALGTTAANITVGDKFIILRGTLSDGGDAPTPLVQLPTRQSNFVEHTSTPYGNTELLQAVKTYGNVHTMEDLAAFQMINHDQYMEHKVLYGTKFVDNTGTRPKYFMGGAFEFITPVTQVSGGGSITFTESQWNLYLEELFEHSGPSQRKQVFLSGPMLRQIQEFKLTPIELSNSDLMKSAAIFSYESSFGQVDLIHHRFLSNAHDTDNFALGLDMEMLEWFNLIPTQIKQNIQSNRAHNREDEIHQASTVKWINIDHHRKFEITP